METRTAWSRRDVLQAGAAASMSSFGAAGTYDRESASSAIRTPLCDLLGIDLPLLQAPMGGVAGPDLVAAVSKAGGLGILPATLVAPDDLRAQIRAIRSKTSRPFGVNLIMHSALQPPIDPSSVDAEVADSVRATLNGFRSKLKLPESSSLPPRPPDLIDSGIEVIVGENVPVFSIGLGRPSAEQIRRIRKHGAKIIAMAATVKDARELNAVGVDIIVAQGSEAGGHRSTWTKRSSPQHAAVGTLALVPQVIAAVTVPVVAAGGITDGRGLVASLALGASGTLIGTRFIATRESMAPEFYKESLLRAGSDDTVITDAFTGLYARVLRNEFTETYATSGSGVFPPVAQLLAAKDITDASAAQGTGRFYPMYAGQGCGTIRDLPSAAELVSRIIAEAKTTLDALAGLG